MNINAVLFNRGSGGNFLARVLTLDPVTVCLGRYDIDSPDQRCDYYCYQELTGPYNKNMKNGLSQWVYKELNEFYFPLTRGIEHLLKLDKLIIEPMHPDHYSDKMALLGPDDNLQLFYIDLQGCESWVEKQVRHKIRPDSVRYIKQNQQYQTSMLNDILSSQPAQSVQLHNIIESELTFSKEYVKICQTMKINSYPELAVKIYRSWRSTWG